MVMENGPDKKTTLMGSYLALQFVKRLLSINKVDPKKFGVANALKELHFIAEGMKNESKIKSSFDEFAIVENGVKVLPKEKFGECLGMTNSVEFGVSLFNALSRRKGTISSTINKEDFDHFLKQLTDKSFDVRLQTFFDMMDKDGDGKIKEEEIIEVIKFSTSANNLSIGDRADQYAALLMEVLDPHKLGYIKLENLRLLQQNPNEPAALTSTCKLNKTKERNPIKLWHRKLSYYLEENKKQIWVMALWIFICLALFTWKFIQFRHKTVFHVLGYCVCVAKGGAELTKFNMALILLSMSRKTLTWLRGYAKLGVVVPFDDNINFHKVIAGGIVVGVMLHAIPHLACNLPRLLHATDDEYEPMKPFFGDPRPPNYWWFVKGREGWTGIVMIVLMAIAIIWAQPWLRTKKSEKESSEKEPEKKSKLHNVYNKLTGFNAFWYSHHFFIIVYVVFVIHGTLLYLNKKWYKNTAWMYVAVPIIWYGCERMIRAIWSRHKKVHIQDAKIYSGRVMGLEMSKPKGFEHESGQYIFVNCPSVSSYEWHPFSITSAPGDESLSVHISKEGDWTGELIKKFSEMQKGEGRADTVDHNGQQQASNTLRSQKLYIDGPYGAPSQDYKKYDVLLLIGLGIGVTPMISIVKDVLKTRKPLGDVETGKPIRSRAYLYWVTRDVDSIEYFKGVLCEATKNGQEEIIDVHYYCSNVSKEGNAKSALISMIQSIHQAKNGNDIFSGTQVKTNFGRPDWRKVFERIADKHADDKVGVFYCGKPTLVKELKGLARDFSKDPSPKFEFHKENF